MPERRNLFFFRRLLNKQPHKRNSNAIEKQYDQVTYLAAMKKFQQRTKGMLPNSPEWTRIRNETYAELRVAKSKQEQ